MNVDFINDINDIDEIEALRREVFNIQTIGSVYKNKLLRGHIKVIGVKYNSALIAGCYFHSFNNSLFIDQVFVKEEYQNQKIGSTLINWVLSHKERLSKIFNTSIDTYYIESLDDRSHDLYINLGFKESKYDDDKLYIRM